jgi:hypothetical protein
MSLDQSIEQNGLSAGSLGGFINTLLTIGSVNGNSIRLDPTDKSISVFDETNTLVMKFDGINGRITVGANNELILDANNKRITVGTDSKVILDAANQRILISDGTTNRVVLGNY